MAFLNINGRSVAYRLLGAESNPLVILAHPLGMTQAVWDDVLAALLPHYRVLTWDLPGHGASEAWPASGGEITPETLAAEALALAEQAGAERFHFVGTSIGGVIGQQLLKAHAERLLSVVLTNTGAVIGNAELWSTRADRVRQEGLAAMAGEIVPRWFAPELVARLPALDQGWRVQMARTDGESYALLCEMLGRTDFRGQLKAVGAKPQGVDVHLLGGSEDMATPPKTLQTLATECGGAPLEVIERIAHVPSVEAPEMFAKRLLKWMEADRS